INPGFSLTLKIKEGIAEFAEKNGRRPEAIFMQNHGLIVHSDDFEKCIGIHDRINNIIRDYLGIKEDYPNISVEKVDENIFASKTKYLFDYFTNNAVDEEFFDRNVLYPDQLVYLNDGIYFGDGDGRISIN